jgi:PAS domain S-box-containing protein
MGVFPPDAHALRLAAIVETSDDAIVSKDLNGFVLSWNRAAERMFGYTAEEMIGRSIRLIIPFDRQAEEDHVLGKIARGEPVEHFETVRRKKDGSFIPVSLTVSPIIDSAGVVVGASKIARDITERRQAEGERARLLAMAQEASRLKDEFLATFSHELRTPLNAILGYARMLRSGLLSGDKQQRAIETVERNAVSLAQIIEDVLDVSRIVSGKIRLNVVKVDLRELVREALETVRPAAESRGVTLETSLDVDDGVIHGDRDRLQQVLWNLLSNGVKFTQRGGRVHVGLSGAGSQIEISVRDTGIGIPRTFLPHVFERFRQAEMGMTRAQGGLGLGLAITRHLVEMHGGTIAADSAGEGSGATFWVRLPVTIAPPVHMVLESPPPQDAPVPRLPVTVTDLKGIRVLAVDDDPDALLMLKEILETAHADVTIASSAKDAFAMLENAETDVLVADLGMPQISGFDLIANVRGSENPDIQRVPAAALTAYARSEDRARALRAGFQIHLSKPIDPTELTAAVAELSGRGKDRVAAPSIDS